MASNGINKVILIGNLGADPETRYMPSGGAVTNVRLATSDTWRDKNSGDTQERTEWHRVVFFNRLAEIAAEYLRKGSKVYVEGSIRTRKWQGQDGQDRYTTEIVANEMQMLGGHGNSDQQHQGSQSRQQDSRGGQGRQYQQQDRGQNQQRQPEPAYTGGGGGGIADFDDDIPFGKYMSGLACHMI